MTTTAPPVATVPAEQQTLAPTTSQTPTRLRRLSLLLVVTCVLVALVGALTLSLLLATLERAREDTAQLVRVQRIQTDLLVADANATNTFLVGGLESPQRRAAYEAALADVGTLVAEAARAQPADADALAALNSRVLTYAGLVETARANNRQGLPVGAQYLRQANATLAGDVLPVADALVEADVARARASMGTGWGFLVPVLALLALAVFVVAQVRVARQFKRRINPGLLVGSLVLLGLLVGSSVALGLLTASVEDTRDGGFEDVRLTAAARTAANRAKSAESLTLVARGSGQAYEKTWQDNAALVQDNLGGLSGAAAALEDWRAHEATHVEIRRLDDAGRWDAAVARATGDGATTSNGTFAPVDVALSSIVDTSGAAAVDALGGHRAGLVVGALLTVLAGLAAAWCGRTGVAARLREYR